MSNRQETPYEQIKPSQRELLSYHILHTVRQVNGSVAFRAVAEQAVLLRTKERIPLPVQYQSQHFGYVLQGEVYVYKRPASSVEQSKYRKGGEFPSNDKIFITNHKVHEIFALQEYPLNWKEQLYLQISQGAKVLMLPLLLSLTSFRKILNTSSVQYRAQILKRCQCFRDIEMDKLKRLALFSKRVQVPKGQVLLRQGDQIQGLIVVISGEIVKVEQPHPSHTYTRFTVIGLQHSYQEDNISNFYLSSPQNCEIMEIPQLHALKLNRLRTRPQGKDSILIKTRLVTQSSAEQRYQRKDNVPAARLLASSQARRTMKGRPLTSKEGGRSNMNIRFATFYNQKDEKQKQLLRQIRTEGDQQFGGSRKTCDENLTLNQRGDARQEDERISLGQMCLRRFLIRKEQRQNGEIMKYLRSGAPELQLNPSKQFAVVKPLHVSDSTYVKNLKRKMKRSYLKGGGREGDNRQSKKRQARFSFFFQEQEGDK